MNGSNSSGSTVAGSSGTSGGQSGSGIGGGSTTGATETGTSGGTASGASTTTGSASSGSTTSSGFHAGCAHPGSVPEFAPCLLASDCACPFDCRPSANGSACLRACRVSADCGDGGLVCDPNFGVCQVPTNCDLNQGAGEFQTCVVPTDCACPLSCYVDLNNGNTLCERPCLQNSDCAVSQVCAPAGGGGSCETACNPLADAGQEFQACNQNTDCACGLVCVHDQQSATFDSKCETPCQGDAQCRRDAGERCDLVAQACEIPAACDPTASVQPYTQCTNSLGCGCPLQCVVDRTFGTKVCEFCDGGICQSPAPPAGDCTVTSPQQPIFGQGQPAPCTSNADCFCPDTCNLSPGNPPTSLCGPQHNGCYRDEDCADPTTVCTLTGQCVPGPTLTQTSSFVCSIDGVPDSGTYIQGSCVAAGTSTTTCYTYASRSQPQLICVAGEVCNVTGFDGGYNGWGTCAKLCSGQGDVTQPCPGGQVCVHSSTALNSFGAVGQYYPNYLVYNGLCLNVEPSGCVDGLAGPPPPEVYVAGDPGTPCTGNQDCACPYVCDNAANHGWLPPSNQCQLPCSTTRDCPDPDSYCNNGVCILDSLPVAAACSSDGTCPLPYTTCQAGRCWAAGFAPSVSPGSACIPGAFGLPDAGAATGTAQFAQTVVYAHPPGALTLVCREPGTAALGGRCQPLATRAEADLLCGSGAVCVPLDDGGAICRPACAGEGNGPDAGCAAGQICAASHLQYACDTVDPINQCGQGGGALEYDGCFGPQDCACPLQCIGVTPANGSGSAFGSWGGPTLAPSESTLVNFPGYCSRPCATSDDCVFPYETCGGNQCNVVGNCPQYANGSCDMDVPGGADGTCVQSQVLGGLCQKAGTATDHCDPNATRANPSELCIPGAVCDTSGPTPRCTWTCGTTIGGGSPIATTCAPGQLCGLPTFSIFTPVVSELCLPAMGVDGGA